MSPATLLLEKRRQMLEVQGALDAQKVEYRAKEEHFRRREEALRKKDLELQEALVLFNKFLKENEAKRRRADRKAGEEIKQTVQKKKEIAARQEKMRLLKEKSAALKEEMARNERYQTYLRRVQSENAGEYPDIEAIPTRYYCLTDAHRDLQERQRAVTEQLERKRNEYVQYNKEQHNLNLAFNNDIARLSKELEEAQKSGAAVEERVDAALKGEAARTLKLSQLIMAVNNLYTRCKSASSVLNHSRASDPSESQAKTTAAAAAAVTAGDCGEAVTAAAAAAAAAELHESAAASSRMEAQRRETEQKLDVICSYIVDFEAIVDKYAQ